MKKRTWLIAFAAAVITGGLVIHAEGEHVSSTPEPRPPTSIVSPVVVEPSPDSAVEPKPQSRPTEKPKPTQTPNKPQPEPAKANPPKRSSSVPAWAEANLPRQTIRKNDNGLAAITNSSSLYVWVNKERNLSSTYAPKDLVVPDVPFSFSGDSPKKQLRKEAAAALEKLFAGADKAGIELKAVSGYRAYATQKAIFERNAEQKGEEIANRASAHPGQSEHQTGLAMDISSAIVGYALEQSFGKTKEGRWLAAHAADYGFIIRYPKGKEEITGYAYEPWHVRYIGKEAAQDVFDNKLTLEQFFDTLEASAEK